MEERITRRQFREKLNEILFNFEEPVLGYEQRCNEADNFLKSRYQQIIDNKIIGRMQATSLDEIRHHAQGVKLQSLRDLGIKNLFQLDQQSAHLRNIPGIGELSASKILMALKVFKRPMESDLRISADPSEWSKDELDYLRIAQMSMLLSQTKNEDQFKEISELIAQSRNLINTSSFFSWIREKNRREMIQLRSSLLQNFPDQKLHELYSYLKSVCEKSNELNGNEVKNINSFLENWRFKSAEVLSFLDSRTIQTQVAKKTYIGDEASVPILLAQQISDFQVDLSGFKAVPRRYQLFGIKFVLVAKKVILGDEMGLGKTIQALGVAQHLKNIDSHFHGLVIAPLAVLDNWRSETNRFTNIETFVLYGKDKKNKTEEWINRGGLAITNFESLAALKEEMNYKFDLVVVDEAHMIKNLGAQRSINSRNHLEDADFSLLMTGTPLENRGEEFVNLISLVNAGVAHSLWNLFGDVNYAYRNASKFRQMVGGIYLRRNRRDVLKELPALVMADEFVAFPQANSGEYESCIRAGNLMGARRALSVGSISTSPKMAKLAEIIESCRAEGHKVLVFSYFKEVLQNAASVVGNTIPIDGEISHVSRQQAIEKFQKTSGFAALVMQIDVGGVGLNLQEASTVVIMEPQFTPGKESQAIGRAYRMDQTRKVMVHRLIVVDGADQRINTALGAKERIAQLLAGTSELSEKTSEAVNEKSILNEERVRLGLAS
jgi:SNF2 family DNA or RNA helicase